VQNLVFLYGCRTGACCRPKLEQFWPRESAVSGEKERGGGRGSIPCLTRSGGALRGSNFARESGAGGLFYAAMLCSWRRPAGGKQAGGDGAGQGRALRRRATAQARRGERAQARRASGDGCYVSTAVRLSVVWRRRSLFLAAAHCRGSAADGGQGRRHWASTACSGKVRRDAGRSRAVHRRQGHRQLGHSDGGGCAARTDWNEGSSCGPL
jgi:hypothetical protein